MIITLGLWVYKSQSFVYFALVSNKRSFFSRFQAIFISLSRERQHLYIDSISLLRHSYGQRKTTRYGGVSEHPIRDIIRLYKNLGNMVFGTIAENIVDIQEHVGEAAFELSKGVKHNQILYNKLILAFPELSSAKPGDYEIFQRVVDGKKEHCLITLKTEPFESTVASRLLHIDKEFFAKKNDDYFNGKYGKPSTSIVQTKRKLIGAVKPFLSFCAGYFHEKVSYGRIHKGDIKVQYSASGYDSKYVFVINNDAGYAKILYKSLLKDSKRVFEKIDRDHLLLGVGIIFTPICKDLPERF